MKIFFKLITIISMILIPLVCLFLFAKYITKTPDNMVVSQNKLTSDYKLYDPNYIDKGIVLIKGENKKDFKYFYTTHDGSKYAFGKLQCQNENPHYIPETMFIEKSPYGIGYHMSYYIPGRVTERVDCYGIVKIIE